MIKARKFNWDECHLQVIDMGDRFIYGRIVDNKDPSIVRAEGLYEFDYDWIFEVSSDFHTEFVLSNTN